MSDTPPSNPVRIVIAEDDEQLRITVVELLTDDGFEVLEAGHAEEALCILCNHAERVHVLFTDVNMPGAMNGLDLAHRAHQRWPWLRVMVGSGTRPEAQQPEYGFSPSHTTCPICVIGYAS
jgi:CheY-like chemotaxis protein